MTHPVVEVRPHGRRLDVVCRHPACGAPVLGRTIVRSWTSGEAYGVASGHRRAHELDDAAAPLAAPSQTGPNAGPDIGPGNFGPQDRSQPFGP